MGRLAGVKLEKDENGKVKKVTLDMKHHARFVEDYLDRLKIEAAKKNADYVEWDVVKAELNKKHGIRTKDLSRNTGTQSRKTA